MIDPVLRALLDACHADPDDDAPRLVLADWLDERDDPFERGRLIRLSVAGRDIGDDDADTPLLRADIDDWRERHLSRWLGPTVPDFGIALDRGLLSLRLCPPNTFADLPTVLREAVLQGWVANLEDLNNDADNTLHTLADWPVDQPGVTLYSSGDSGFDRLKVAFPPRVRNLRINRRESVFDTPDGPSSWTSRYERLRGLDLASFNAPTSVDLATLARLPHLDLLKLRVYDESDERLPIACLGPMSLSAFPRLRYLGLIGDWPEEPARIDWPAHLEHLEVFIERGAGPAVEGIGDLVHLRFLELYDWQAFDGDASFLDRLSRLRTLSLWSANGWSDDCLPHLAGLHELERLTIRDSEVFAGGDGLRHLAGLPSLRVIDFTGNENFSGEGLHHLAGLPALRSLDLDLIHGLTDHTLAGVGELTGLERLSLNHCPVGPETTAGLARLTNLRALSLRGVGHLQAIETVARLPALAALSVSNYPGDADLRALGQRSSLQALNLWNASGLTAEGVAALAGLPRLHTLSLSAVASLPSNGLDSLRSLPALRDLTLCECGRLEPEKLQALADMPALRSLNLGGCELDEAEIERLREALPNTHVHWW